MTAHGDNDVYVQRLTQKTLQPWVLVVHVWHVSPSDNAELQPALADNRQLFEVLHKPSGATLYLRHCICCDRVQHVALPFHLY